MVCEEETPLLLRHVNKKGVIPTPLIDMHCHILPGIDDGSPDMETTMRMIEIAESDNIGHIVASPHYRHAENQSFRHVAEILQNVQDETARRGKRVKLYSGADVRLTYELLDALRKKEVPTINNSRYFLLELPDIVPPRVDDFIFEFRVKGFVPIITHPERNYSLLSAPNKAAALRKSGALFQLTAMSITGAFGRQVKKFSLSLLREGQVDFVASDAHGAKRRIPVLSDAFRDVTEILDEKTAQTIFVDNPRSVLENEEMPRCD